MLEVHHKSLISACSLFVHRIDNKLLSLFELKPLPVSVCKIDKFNVLHILILSFADEVELNLFTKREVQVSLEGERIIEVAVKVDIPLAEVVLWNFIEALFFYREADFLIALKR